LSESGPDNERAIRLTKTHRKSMHWIYMDRRLRYHSDLNATFARNRNYERITVTRCMHIFEMCACETSPARAV